MNKVTVKICVKFREPPRIDDLEEDDDGGDSNSSNNSSNNNNNNSNNSNITTANNNNNNSNNNKDNNQNASDNDKNNDDDEEEGHDFHWFVIEDCKKHAGSISYYKCPISGCSFCTDKGSRLKKHLVEEHSISLDRILDRKVA